MAIPIARSQLDARGVYTPTPEIADGSFRKWRRARAIRTPYYRKPVCANPPCQNRVYAAGKCCRNCAGKLGAMKRQGNKQSETQGAKE